VSHQRSCTHTEPHQKDNRVRAKNQNWRAVDVGAHAKNATPKIKPIRKNANSVAQVTLPEASGILVEPVLDAPSISVDVALAAAYFALRLPRASVVQFLSHIVEDGRAQADDECQCAQQRHFDDAEWVGNRLAELLPIELADKQSLLEIDDPLERLDALLALVPE
jgi:hypothetical protein